MGLFFSQPKKVHRVSKRQVATPAILRAGGCGVCKLSQVCKNKEVKPTGSSDGVDIYILSEPPTAKQASPLSDTATRMLDKLLPRGIVTRESNIARSPISGKNKDVMPIVHCCSSKFIADIEKSKPTLVLGLGFTVLPAVLPGQNQLDAWRGLPVPVQFGSHTCWFMPTYHPSFARSVTDANKYGYKSDYEQSFEKDVKHALRVVKSGKEPIVYDENMKGKVLHAVGKENELASIKMYLDAIGNTPEAGLDIETTGFKPYTMGGEEQLILSIAVSNGEHTVSFPLDHPKAEAGYRDKIWDILIEFLMNDNCTKIAHNLKFELLWLTYFVGDIALQGRWDDTMLNSYVLKNRKGTNSLAFNTLQYLGVNVKALTGFSAAECLSKPIDELIEYNALDAYWTFLLWKAQRPLVQKVQEECRTGLLEATFALTETELEGMPFNRAWTAKHTDTYKSRMEEIVEEFRASLPAKQFTRVTGRLFNPGSDTDLPIFLCDILSQPRPTSFDESALKSMHTKWAEKIIEYRKTQKILSTYLEGWTACADDTDTIHPSFNVLLTATNRLSSSAPNAQNCPKRGPGKWVRGMIQAPPGYIMASLDYAQVEARAIGALSRDPVYIDALWDNYDIHMEWARHIARAYPDRIGGADNLNDKAVMKALRQDMKSGWTFALLFGAGANTVANTLKVPRDTVDPLIDKFWKQFRRSKEWQDELHTFYKKHWYVETIGGFRRYGPLSHNDIINTPVQGSAAEIAKAGIVIINKKIQPINCTIHDSLEFFIKEKSYEQTLEDIAEIMTTVAITKFGLDNIPWCVEAEVGQTWADLSVYKEWSSADFGHIRNKSFTT